MEDLNKTQLVLLTLLVSFVTSIATGIITTSLLAEAPVSITQTINRVVERTIETVSPSPEAKEVSLKSEDKALLVAVSKVSQSVVKIEEKVSSTSTTTPRSFMGVIATGDGIIVTSLEHVRVGQSYIAVLPDETRLPLALATTSAKEGVAIFKILVGSDSVEPVSGAQ